MIQDATMNKIQEKQEEKKVPAWAKELSHDQWENIILVVL